MTKVMIAVNRQESRSDMMFMLVLCLVYAVSTWSAGQAEVHTFTELHVGRVLLHARHVRMRTRMHARMCMRARARAHTRIQTEYIKCRGRSGTRKDLRSWIIQKFLGFNEADHERINELAWLSTILSQVDSCCTLRHRAMAFCVGAESSYDPPSSCRRSSRL